MSKRGKTPSLIGGGAGKTKFVQAQRKRSCKRCEREIPRDVWCAEVTIPASMGGHKTYCGRCFSEILDQSEVELARLRREHEAHP